MIKEVEFSNMFEIINPAYPYSDGVNQLIFDGALSEEGKTLDITVGNTLPLPSEGARQLILYFGNVDFDNNIVEYVKIGETALDNSSPASVNNVYTFDLSKVLMIPRRIYNNQGTSEITIQLYTYEANITTDYGTKRLSVPYSISNDSVYEYDKSTDGIFRLYMVDYKLWNISTEYNKGDIVYYGDGVLISTVDGNIGVTPSTEASSWATPTEQEIIEFAYGSSANQPLGSIISDIMISRYAKYTYILETLLKTGFKAYDDQYAYELTSMLQTIRERAVLDLLDHRPIKSAYGLQQLKRASSTNNLSSKVQSYNIKYTI